MFDLGRTLLAVVERSPDALAIVDGERRLSYAAWYREIGRVGGGLAALGLSRRDRLAVILQNRLEMATLHWACQFVGIVVTPLNWRIKAEELDYCLGDADAGAIVFDEMTAAAVGGAVTARRLPRIAIGGAEGGTCRFEELAGAASGLAPQAGPEDLSLLLYTSGTTGRPKGVPRRQRAERAAALAHVAQNLYCRGERTLGVMPLYHTTGVRSLLAMALIDGAFICQHHFDAAAALRHIARERITSLYLVPTLYHDLVGHPDFAACDTSSVTKLGFAGAAMPDGLLKRVDAAFRPALFVKPLRLLRDLHLHDRAARRGEAGLGREGRAEPADPDHQVRHRQSRCASGDWRGGPDHRRRSERRGIRKLLATPGRRCPRIA